jgi:hypothetical protein
MLGEQSAMPLTPAIGAARIARTKLEQSRAMDHRSFRDMLLSSIGFAIESNRALLRRILKEHVSDDAREMLAKKVPAHLELSGFEIDEGEQLMRKRPPNHGHG